MRFNKVKEVPVHYIANAKERASQIEDFQDAEIHEIDSSSVFCKMRVN